MVGTTNRRKAGTARKDKAIRARELSAQLLLQGKIHELSDMGIASPEIVLVTHGGFLHYMTDDWEDSGCVRWDWMAKLRDQVLSFQETSHGRCGRRSQID
jgi:hypothetical protein